MRFGNRAFKTFIERVFKQSAENIATLCSQPEFLAAIPELKGYWEESFGHHERLDYGTGHELNFVVFMLCLFKMGVYT